MPEKSGRAHTEADFVYSLSLGVDAFKIISTAIMLLQLLFLTRQSGLGGSWEVQLCRGGTGEPPWHLSPLLTVPVSHGHSTVPARGPQMTPD